PVAGRRRPPRGRCRARCLTPLVSDTMCAVSHRKSGVAIVVWRNAPQVEVLLLHRARFGPDYEGDWAWMTPGGGREPSESVVMAAHRELREETGLELECARVDAAWPLIDVEISVFAAQAPAHAEIRLSGE